MNKTLHFAAAAFIALAATGTAFAQATITHDRALAGNVTPGDTAGYPVTINQPGHYKLMGNLVVPAGSTGIVITARDVTLDLNGFSIRGPVSCTGAIGTGQMCSPQVALSNGVHIHAAATNAQVRNGTVGGFGNHGLHTEAAGRFTDLTLTDNVGNGAYVVGSVGGALFERVRAERNRYSGFWLNQPAVLLNVMAMFNGAWGITSATSEPVVSYITDSLAHGNHLHGLRLTNYATAVLRGNTFLLNNSGGGNMLGTPIPAGGNYEGTTFF
jgi:hypothetical protein